MGRHHDCRAGVQRLADRRHRSPDPGVFGDLAGIVLRHIEIGAYEHALALELTLLGQVGEANELHVDSDGEMERAVFYRRAIG